MEEEATNEKRLLDDAKLCLECQEIKPLNAFLQHKVKVSEYRKTCCECEQIQQQERHRRLAVRRETWQRQQQERTERRQQSWQRSVALRQIQEERAQERENWYLQQPERRCRACQQLLPALAFGINTSSAGFMLHVHCRLCHQALLERRMLPCCLCQRRTARRDFLATFKGYLLSCDGSALSLCCKDCEAAFQALSDAQQRMHIHLCCQRTFPSGQVIYAEVDPVTDEIRYIGRTGKPARRHAQHLCDRSATTGQWGSQKTAWYTRRNWMQALVEQGLQPSMRILQPVENSPLVLEWEQRFIWHGIQQGWPLLNWETMDTELVARIQSTHLDFLQAPFELLVQHHFFAANGLIAFLSSAGFSELPTMRRGGIP